MQGQCSGIRDAGPVQWGSGCRDGSRGIGIQGAVSAIMQKVCAGLSSAAASGQTAVMHVEQQQTKTRGIVKKVLEYPENGR